MLYWSALTLEGSVFSRAGIAVISAAQLMDTSALSRQGCTSHSSLTQEGIRRSGPPRRWESHISVGPAREAIAHGDMVPCTTLDDLAAVSGQAIRLDARR